MQVEQMSAMLANAPPPELWKVGERLYAEAGLSEELAD